MKRHFRKNMLGLVPIEPMYVSFLDSAANISFCLHLKMKNKQKLNPQV
jgi:hypothetical protein